MAAFSTPLHPSFPFYRGSLVAAGSGPSETGGVEVCVPQTITLDGYTFPVEVKDWRSGPQDTFRDTVVTSGLPDEALFNARGAWARYRLSWHHGAGQSLGDLDETADPLRFESSFGMYWPERYELTLNNAVVNRLSSVASNQLLIRSGDYVFCAAGINLYRSSDLETWTLLTAPGGTILALTTDGTDLYVATSTLTVKYAGTSTTSTAFATPVVGNCTAIGFVSNRLLVAKSNVLYEVSSTGSLTTLQTHFQPSFSWTTLFAIGSRIYVGGFSGSRSELYTLTTDSTGTLVRGQEAAPLPAGEKLRTAVAVAGSAALCTSAGVRIAQVSGDGTLTYGPLISDPGDVRCAVADGRFMFTGWSDMGDGRCGLARLVLDDELNALQPVYGADLFQDVTQGAVTGVAVLNGRIAFASEGSGVWVQSLTTFVGQGELESGRLAFGTVERKGLASMSLEFAPLVAGESIETTIRNQDGVNIGSGVTSEVGATQLEVDLDGEQVTFIKVTTLILGPGTSSPKLYRWRVRAWPVPPPVQQWVLPLIIADTVIVGPGNGIPRSMDVSAVHKWIEHLWATKQYTLLRVGDHSYRVRCENFEWRPTKWTAKGDVPMGQLIVQLVSA